MKKRMISLALALLMVLAPAAPALAADDGWQEYTMVYGDCDIHFSKCKLSQVTVCSQGGDEASGSPLTATVITVALGSTIDTHFNEKVTEISQEHQAYLMEDYGVNSPEELIGLDCYANASVIFWSENDQVYYTDIAYNLATGTVTETWHQDHFGANFFENVDPGIPYLFPTNADGKTEIYLVVAENYPIHEMEASFTDVGSAYTDAVKWAVDNKFAEAKSATTFGAETPCPRGEVVEILWKALGSPEPTSTVNPFADVKETDSFYKAVLWAAENGITTGTTAATFSPMNPVTRAQMVTFLYRQLVEKA